MYGNKLGWGIAAGIAIIAIGLIVMIEMGNKITPPTKLTLNASNMATIQFPIAPETIVPMNESGDAGERYARAVADYRRNRQAYQKINNPAEGAALPGIREIVQATPLKGMSFAAGRADALINHRPPREREDLEALRELGLVCGRVGLLYKKSNPAEAMKYYNAQFALGAKMFNERLIMQEMEIGIQLIAQSIAAMKSVAEDAKNDELVKKYDAFYTALLDYQENSLNPVWRAISSIDDKVIARHSGDVFVLATSAEEKLWRVEATLSLGRMRFKANRAADNRGATRVLKTLARDSDEHVAMAAKKALELTVQDVRQLGGW
jgi:hypothetical protein